MPQFNPGLEDCRQILHQRAEVHPAVGGEVEQNFAVVEGVFHRHQLHVQLVLADFLLADGIGLFFMQLVFFCMLHILCAGDAHHLLEGRRQLLVI